MNTKELMEKRKSLMISIDIENDQLKALKGEVQQIDQEIRKKMTDEGVEKVGVEGLSVC